MPQDWVNEPISIVEPDPDWTVRADRERKYLEGLLAHWLTGSIEHVGSTAIPDLPAKPIIDLQAPVTDLDDPEPIVATLVSHGWHYVPPELDQRPWRRFFIKVAEGRRSAQLHVTTLGNPEWHEHIAFRDALRDDPTLTADYAVLKRRLAAAYADDREAYTAAKTDFIRTVLHRTI